jgi:dCTP deaminase
MVANGLIDFERSDTTLETVYETQIQPASIDITIGDTFSTISNVQNGGIIDFDVPVEYRTTKRDSYVLLPKQFVLATTREYIKLPNNMTAFVEGRSSIGRLGLFIQNAGWVDPGFEGQITLELFNATEWALNIKAGDRVGQLVFAKMDRDAVNPYKGKYQCQTGATGSMLYKDYN